MLLLILLYLATVRIYCFASKKDIVLNDDDNTTCSYKKCINKCCAKNQYAIVGENNFICTDIDFKTNYSTVYLYDRHEHDKLTNKTLGDMFMLLPGKFSNDTFLNSQFFYDSDGLPTYLNEEGLVYTEVPNTYYRWRNIPTTDFCIDYFVGSEFGQSVKLRLSIVEPTDDDDDDTREDYEIYGIILSAVFLGLILLVYFLLPELQSLGGKILMSCVGSMMVVYVLLAIMKYGSILDQMCIILTCAIYYFFMATFCWMNVMSYDIWWTFRFQGVTRKNYALPRQIPKRSHTSSLESDISQEIPLNNISFHPNGSNLN
ncbi:G-protein coupled receptor Mth2-like isoform X3 [Leptidea sinapis]|uniref:G-protein coupled receptor Mth2-like isoform X3 n=1 Tax=Leptidea sinapis TaxID=189913 RepID=UPI0021C39607|nr:G-protein coupled receptor Mth2-like isoform X3 [Leptidea sinapis]